MKMNKCLTFFAVFALAMWAKAETIDSIYEIRSWNLNTGKIDKNPYSSPDQPIGGPGVGDPDPEFAFVVRLFNAKWDSGVPLENTEPWVFKYTGLGSEATAEVLFPPTIGIVIGGRTEDAVLDRWPHDMKSVGAPGLTQMVFKYTAQPGDLALPVLLACDGEGHAIGTDDTKPEIYLWGDWALTNASGDSARLVFYQDWKRSMSQPEGVEALTTNTDLAESGFYIKNIDFKDHNDSSRWYEAGTAWRGIHKNSTESEPFAAEIVATGIPKRDSPVVYVWSDNEDLITLEDADGTEQVEMVNPADPSGKVTRWVYACKFTSSGLTQKIPAKAKVDSGSTILYLSPTKGFRTLGTGEVDPKGYLAIPVACIAELAPNVEIESSREAVIVPAASDTNFKPVAEINVKVAPGYTGDTLTLTVTPEISGVAGLDKLGEYVRISDSDGVGAWSSAGASWTKQYTDAATIFAGFTQKLYIYALGADNKTAEGNFSSQGVIFKPSVDPTAASHFSGGYKNAQVYFNFESPKLTTETPEKNAVGGADVAFDLMVADNYKNINDSTGYQIYYQKDGDPDADLDSNSWTDLGGRWGVDLSSRKLYKIEEGVLTTKRPSLKYAAGDYNTSFYLRAPTDNSIRSLPLSIKVHVSEPAQISAQISPDNMTFADTGTYEEGKDVYVKFTLTKPYQDDTGKSCYAFLEPLDEATSNSVSGAMIIGKRGEDDEGVEIENGKAESIIDPIYSFKLLDGKTPSTRLSFKIVLCKPTEDDGKGTYSKDRIIGGYNSNNLRFYSTNVIPTVGRVYMGSNYVDSNLDTMHDQKLNPVSVPKGVKKVFTFKINEPSDIDRTAKDESAVKPEDDKKIFVLRYSIVEGKNGKETVEEAFVYGNPNDSAKFKIEHTFTIAGDALVKVQVADKDMRDADGNVPWTDEEAIVPFYFYVKVASQPYISIVDAAEEQTIDGREFLETDLGFKLRLKLSEVQDVALPVEVRVTPLGTGTNPGKLEFAGLTSKGKEGNVDIYTGTIAAQGDEESPMDGRLQFTFKDLDGTSESRQNGFKIEAKVVDDPNKTEAENKNSDDKKWSDYYASAEATVYINNVAPVIVISPASLGAYTSATNAAPKAPTSITWNVTQEAADDLSTGLEYTWSVNGKVQSTAGAKVMDKTTQTFTPTYDSPGVVDIVLTVKDKDDETVDGVRNGYYEQTWYVTVAATKSLTTIAHGPSAGIATSSLSKYYNTAKGLGEGYVWADGSLDRVRSFELQWNMGSKELAEVVAVGYKKGHTSSKQDDKYEIALNDKGSEKGESETAYSYPGDKDSYFYAWLRATKSDSGVESAIYGGLSPEKAGETPTPSPVYLPTEKGQDDLGYEATTMEAIFSKEYRVADNCGDINQDGIPDLAVVEYGFGIADKNKVTGDDLADVSAYNDDEDFLPGKSSSGNSLVPNVSNNWETVGGAFNAFLEIRGFGEGLNARYPNADESLPDRDFTIYEEMAFRTYYNETEAKEDESLKVPVATEDMKALAALNEEQANALTAFWKDENRCKWTPENPTSPIEADTDKDGLPDGYEYWFWYGATVGYPNGEGKWQELMKGYKFNEDDVEKEEIPAADVALAFNPTVPGVAEGNEATRGTLRSRDFDNDGLTDFEEFLIGTNPINCDSDGDGMPDGWEVLRGLNPLSNEEVSPSLTNPDGDFMAVATLEMYEYIDGIKVPGLGTAFVEWDEGDTHKVYVCPDRSIAAFAGNEAALMAKGSFRGAHLGDGDRDKLFFTMNVNGAAKTIPRTRALQCAKVSIPATATSLTVYIDFFTDYTIIHDQVYAYLGFDPRTAWYSDSVGCLGVRWHSKGGLAGMAENTTPYYTIDEFLLFKYRKATGAFTDKDKIMDKFQANTTNPSKPYSKTYGDMESEYANERHGADTDGDGVPDGWELYVGLDPNNAQDANPDTDDDTLRSPLEFAGTDSTIAYKDCESIYANKGAVWPNKFFPTDPNNADTDGDGIEEGMQAGQEGGQWLDVFYDGRETYGTLHKFTFNYDNSYDTEADQSTICFRGGGMNPCAVDTDFDGLPDPWEMQFAGIVVDGAGNVMFNNAAEYTERLKIADGLFNARMVPTGADDEGVGDNGNGYYIIGGMDATHGLDAFTDYTGSIIDSRTHTFRDYDFDGDGLQNWQEYLVQAVRSFRYDDAETPLNGRVVWWLGDEDALPTIGPMPTAAEEEEEEIEPGDVAVSPRASKDAAGGVAGYEYPQFDYCDVDAYKLAVFGDEMMPNSMVNIYNDPQNLYAANGEEWDWAALGYMAPAPNVWDPCNIYMFGKIMLPPTALMRYVTESLFPANLGQKRIEAATYVSTDPRRWDSDDDGMDDYWELYHGLNPIYGGSGSDIIADAYGLISADMNAWNEFGNTAPSLDFEKYPWLAGDPIGDPDGDKLRNFEEAINGNLTSPTTKHTDPSPLWMTEPTALLSVTRQSYGYLAGLGAYGWLPSTTDDDGMFAYSFERNEGFDTDNDWTTDSIEVTKGVIGATDPLVGSDPYHRSAIHFDGAGAAYQRTPVEFNNSYDMFRQFTVECWVKPEAKGGTILERGSTYDPATAGDIQGETHWRANFRLELTAEGKVRGLFDSSAAVESGTVGVNTGCAIESPSELPLNQWSHVALSYDGVELCLYVNGEETVRTATSLVPANGVVTFLQDPTSTNSYPSASFVANPGAFVIGARHILDPMEFPVVETLGTYLKDFFAGYVSEVRIWDGARAGDAIKSEYTKAYTDEDVAANRDEIYAAWQKNGERNDNATTAGKQVLPPQLIQHYNFSSLPGAVAAGDVAKTPNDFGVDPKVNDGDNEGYQIPQWWADNDGTVKSAVYTDYRLVPWIENTVTHLKRFDGSFADSLFWAENRANYAPSSTVGFDSYAIPNGGNPYGFGALGDELGMRLRKTVQLAGAYPAFDEAVMKIRFEARYGFVGNSDLVPLGDAWAKRDVDYWDGQGAMTAWTQTGADLNGNGIPDWYETLYPGKTGEEYMRDLVAGLMPDGTQNPDFRDKADFNGNGLPDWWEQIYGISGQNGHTDSDKDGLSNYVEYLLNEVYTIPGTSFDPINPKTNGYVPDAYAKLGRLYIADVFTDHDHMDDTWEVKFGNLAAVSPYVYDANKDADGDGWTNYAEFQADTDPTKNASLAIDGIEVAQYPVPIIEASITYLGEQNVNCPIVVQAWNCADEKSRTFQSIPDAKWTIGEVNADNDNRTTSNTNGMAKTKFVGMNPGREVMTHLSPGSVVAGSFKLECKDPGWVAVDIITGQGYIYGADTATWEESAHDKMRNDGSGKGDIVLWHKDETGRDIVLGEINYATGAVTLDFTALPEYMDFAYNLADPTDASRWSVYTYANCYMRFSWLSKPVTAGKTAVYYLGDADPRSETNNSVGHIREGKNNFIVFADTIQANGKYDPGEPFGIAYGVDVGWNYGKLAIELTDTNPVFARYQATTGLTDRQVIRSDTGDVIDSVSSGAAVDATTHWVRAYMTAVKMNGAEEAENVYINGYKVMDKVIDFSESGRDYLHEGDILDPDKGIYDIGWGIIPEGAANADTAEAIFSIILGNAQIDDSVNGTKTGITDIANSTNATILAQSIVRRYDSYALRKVPTPVAPGGTSDGVVYSARPVFKWTDNGYNSYTAFQIEVSGDDGFVWNSGIQLMPARGADGYYTWVAPICVGDITPGSKVFANDKTYNWKITSLNAKFRQPKWSATATFRMNVPEDQLDYGTIEVAVKYFGHPDVLTGGTVRVEAFDTPDFSGLSASAGYVKTEDKNSVSSTTTAPAKNASIIGLTEGSYYVMAYIDTNNNGKRDNWESWGYACVRDQRDGIIYTSKSIKVGPKVGTHNLVTVYIDDCDTDQDGLPDAWEWKKSGNLTANGAAELDPRTAGSYVSMKDLVGTLDDTSKKNEAASGLATLMSTSLGNANLLAAMMNLDVGEGEDPNDAIIKATTDAKIAEHSLSIANFEVVDGKAKFKVVADVESAATDSELAVFYTFPAVENLTVEYRILKYTSLAAKPIVAKEGTITLGKTEAVIEMPLAEEDATGAMYQIKVFQK